ncbi:MAG: GyrI-like domain-containing protein [Fibrobacterota bacterium]
MDHELVHLPEFTCIGLEAVGSLAGSREWIPLLWEEFIKRSWEVPHLDQSGAWGLMSDTEIHLAPWGGARGRYLASRKAPPGTQPTKDWVAWTIPDMTWMRIPCRLALIPEAIAHAKEFQRNHPEWRWGSAVHEFYPASFRNPSTDELHLMAGLLPR